MVSIKKMIVPDNLAKKVTYGGTNQKKYITIHQTGNTSKGADAQAHARLQANGNSRSASWHYQVDDKEIIQSFEDSAQCWHAGDGRSTGNLNSIGIELCINSDGNYKKTLENGAELVRHLMDKYNISINNVKQHNHWSGKNCPAQIRANKQGISWNDFLGMVTGGGKKVASKQIKSNKSATSTQKSTYKGNSIVEYLQSIGQPSSFAHRKKLASQYGIKNYTGTASQNIKLLNALRGNKTTAKSVKNYTPRTFKVGQTVALKKSASRFATGERIADFAKGKKYKIIQVKSDRVLLGGIMSWVNKSDVE
ncbi:N-acetylmuramoyl-L-alanine amidase [Gracilibacillus dipsosauri]|uniref:N-acetylmuramoyl-L-alanine amidase n=1 Tax=Gracilibacillus dipsosauri TaxID=178340 RepID=UPI0024090886